MTLKFGVQREKERRRRRKEVREEKRSGRSGEKKKCRHQEQALNRIT